MTGDFRGFQETNDHLARVDRSTRYLPVLAQAAGDGLAQSIRTNANLETMNGRLARTNSCLATTARKLDGTNRGFGELRGDLARVGASMDSVDSRIRVLRDMPRLLGETNAGITVTVGMRKMTNEVSQVRTGLGEMQLRLQSMDEQLAAVKDVRTGLQSMQTSLNQMDGAQASLPHMKQSLDQMSRQLDSLATQFAVLSSMQQSLDTTNLRLSDVATSPRRLEHDLPR